MEETIPLEIPNTLLQKAKILNKDTIGSKYDFIKYQGNSFIQVEPPSAKFMGYEINKLNTIKVKVINKATIPQRIHVLPLESNNFTIKMNKKGLLPTGMSEEIQISFKPTEYKYFYDTIRINTETENVIIPIHAYPVLDRDNLRNVFPRLIDFGTILIGETNTISNYLVCKIPINFEFEFIFQKDHPDMKIIPMKGIIPGNGQVDIDIQYTPSTNTTIICEAELRISQFDFEPLKIRLMGSGRYEDPAQNKKTKMQSLQGGNSKRPLSNTKLKKLEKSLNNSQLEQGIQQFGSPQATLSAGNENILLGSKKQSNADAQNEFGNQVKQVLDENNANLQRISSKFKNSNLGNTQNAVPDEKLNSSVKSMNSERNFKVRNINSASVKNRVKIQAPDQDYDQMSISGNQNIRSQQEREFIEKCNAVALMDKNKDIKFFQCIGDEVITEDETQNILTERKNYHQSKLDHIQHEGVHRYTKKINQDHVMLGQRNQELQMTNNWDTDKNDNLKLRKIILKRFMNAGTKIILKMRMENRLIKLKNLLCDCQTKEDVKKLVQLDWQKAEYAGVGKKEFIAFEFSFTEDDVSTTIFPIQYDASNLKYDHTFEINPRKDFNDLDLHEYEVLPRNEVEAMRYTNFERLICSHYTPIETDRVFRTGAEWEYSSQGKTGAFKEISSVQGLAESMPKTFLKPFELPNHLFITSHDTLRPYINYNQFNEVDPEYYLQPEYMEIQDNLDPKMNNDYYALKNEFLGKTPGLSSRFALHSIYSETIRYLPKQLQLPRDCANINKVESACPSKVKVYEYDDNLTDDDSDGEEPPVVQIQNVDDFLKQLEDKDNQITQIRDKNKERLPFDEYEDVNKTVNTNLNLEKKYWISTIPTRTDHYNKFINNSENKLIIL
ncbi:hypothetical protein ABPG74_014165 [Tetrahymena malaccensis]